MRCVTCLIGATVVSLAAIVASPAIAGQPVESKAVVEPKAESASLCESIFALPTLYKNNDNPVIQKFAIIGRYQGQYYYLDSNQGDADDWENRRARIGAAAQLFHDFKFSFNLNLGIDGDSDRFFEDLEDGTLSWEPSKKLSISVGKQKAPITPEWRTSSTKILTFERSLLVNQIVPNKMGGVLVASELESGLLLDAGIYSGSTDDDWAWPTFDGGPAAFASVGYKSKAFGTARAEFLYVDDDESSNLSKGFDNVFSVSYENRWDAFGLSANGIYATGAEASDVFGVTVIPTYDITEKLQAVARYQYAGAERSDGLRLQSRYEREAPDLSVSTGDSYHAIYAGLNYFICGHNLKLMAGAEFATMDQSNGDNYESVTFLTGVRLFF